MKKMKEVKKYLRTSSDEEIRQFIVHCEHLLDSSDDDLRGAARDALKNAREERAERELLAFWDAKKGK